MDSERSIELRMIDEIEEEMDLFDQILAGTSLWHSPISPDELAPILIDEPMMNASTESQESPQATSTKKTFCTCSKSMCRQKYCPCFKEGSKCGP